MKKVSVIITTFNGEKTIERTINSILKQEGIDSCFKLELIVVDDCSTDRTVQLLEKFGIEVISTVTNSGGPNKGRNIGLRKATGDFICITDQDDEWINGRIKTMIPYLEKVPVISCGYSTHYIAKNKKVDMVKSDPAGYVFYERNKTFFKKLTKSTVGQNFYLGAIMFRNELKNNFFEESFGMVDYDWGLRLFHLKESIEVCDSLYIRYVDGSNLSFNEKYRRNDFYYSLMSIEEYEDLYPKEVRLANLRIHGSRARYYYLKGNMRKARFFFVRSPWNFKTLAYYLTTFAGSRFVKRKFTIFG
jgi:glycosyltransferase involved in cell wall biosynthesis